MPSQILLEIDQTLGNLPPKYRSVIESQARKVLRRCQTAGIVPIVSILACSDATIRAINRRWLKRDRATNVIAFRSVTMEAAVKHYGPVPLRKNALQKYFGSAKGIKFFLGDLAIGIERAIAEAREAGQNPADRIGDLVVHGLLHIIGYNHAGMKKVNYRRQQKERHSSTGKEVNPTAARRCSNESQGKEAWW